MKKNVKTKTLSWLLALAMLLSLVPSFSLTAHAEAETPTAAVSPANSGTVEVVEDGNYWKFTATPASGYEFDCWKANDDGAFDTVSDNNPCTIVKNSFLTMSDFTAVFKEAAQTATYAQYKNTTTVITFDNKQWYLIDYDSTTVTLLSKECVGKSAYNSSGSFVTYDNNPTVKEAVDTWYSENITADAKTAVADNKAFILESLNGINPDVLKCNPVEGTYSNLWWLCSRGTSDKRAQCVDGDVGYLDDRPANWEQSVRPALKLDLSKVEFNSETKTFAVKPTVIEYRLWVGDVQVTGANMDDVLGDKDSGATVTFTPATTGENPTPATLTLKGATVTDYFAGVCVRYGVNDTLVINLEGDNTIGSDSEDGLNTGLETRGSLIIQGNGKLAVKGRYNGINCNGDITIESGEITASGLNSGIQSGNENEITLNGGKVTAKGNTGIAGYGGVTIAGADVNAEGVNYAIFTADKDITISAGTVNATATGANTWQKALNGTVKNSIYGTGWTDSSGTEGKTAIATSTTGQDLSDYKKVIFVSHTHDFTYSADGATITATCTADGCADPAASATLTIVAPALTTYGGTGSAAATLTGLTDFNSATGKTIAATDIKYVGRDGTTYTESTTAPTNAGKYTAKITVEEKTASVNYEIAKVNPTYTVPTGLTATCGQTLKDITLPTGWSWATNTQSVGGVGTNTFKATFTPTDTTNYNTISDIEVKVTVSKAAGKKAYINTDTMSYNDTTIYIEGVVGQEYVIIPKGTPITDSDWEKSIKPDSERENWVFFENLKEATEYEIYARTAATETAFASDAVKANVYTTLSSIGLDYDSTLVGATVKVMPEPEIEGLTYKWYQDVATEDDEGVIHHDLTEIAGAAGDTYTFRTEDIGKGITVKIFAGKAEVGEIEIEGPVTLTATVNFDSMGGSDVKEITDVEYRAKIEAPKDPIRKGYAFAGWYWEEEYLTPFDFQNDLITWENTTLYAKWTPVNYSIISVTGLSGANDNQWTKGTKDGVVITVKVSGEDNSFDHFIGVKLDGVELVKDVDYTVEKGSTIVTLLPATLEKLSVGEHTVTVLFDNGEVNTELTVNAANSGNPTSPQTGDNSHTGLWIALMILSLCALAATLFIGKKKRVFDR